jgi:hypothetical protein
MRTRDPGPVNIGDPTQLSVRQIAEAVLGTGYWDGSLG